VVTPDFLDPGVLQDGDLKLVVRRLVPADPTKGWVPAYEFAMLSASTGAEMGKIALRLGDTHFLVMYGGQIGYSVSPEYRGHRYAARSVRLLLPLAKRHGISPLWITCNPDNIASRRTCEFAGGQLIDIVPLPEDCDMYQRGEREKCRYRFDI